MKNSYCDCCGQILTALSARDAWPERSPDAAPSSRLGEICSFCGWEQDETPDDTDANHATRREWLAAYQKIRCQIWELDPGQKSRAVLARVERERGVRS